MNKQTELLDLQNFLFNLSFAYEEIIPDEKPDFTIITSIEKIGIEHTEFNSDNKYSHDIRSVQDTIESIKNDLKTEFQNSINANFVFNFSLRKPIKKRIKKKQKTEILKFLLQQINLPAIRQAIYMESFSYEFEYNEKENEFIDCIHISKCPNTDSVYVSTNDIYWTGSIKEGEVQIILDSKAKLIDFSKNNKNWLLIVIAEKEYSDGAYINETADIEYKTSFDRVFFYTRLEKKVYELKKATR